MSELNRDSLKIYTFKWGTKYSPEYVNRLYNSLKKYCKTDFQFNCITDNSSNIYSEIKIIDYSQFQKTPLFTLEKIELMNKIVEGNNIILDLDILIHNDITDLCVRHIDRPTFIWTHWTPKWHWEVLVPKKTACFVNSSFVRWTGDSGKFLWDYYLENKQYLDKEYQSCDKYLFYEHHLKESNIAFWEDGDKYFYNYNEQGPQQYKFNPNASCCLFNTSHLVKMNRRYFELDNTPNWATELWESYDEFE